MKDVGIIRKVDELGRIVLPIEMRRVLEIKEKDQLEISCNGEAIILKKYKPYCIFCGSEDVISFNGSHICKKCCADIRKLK